MTDTDTDLRNRIRDRLAADLRLDDADVDGVMTIVDEELGKRELTLEEWACDRCGERKATATEYPDGESLCNHCLFSDDQEAES